MNTFRKTLGAIGLRARVVGYNPIGRLHKAVRDGDLEEVTRLLLRGSCHVNDIDKKNRTPLHYACAYGQTEVVDFLVKNKCDIHLCDSDNNTPLIKAIQQQEEECATILLENGADVNVQDPNGGTPLHHAACTNNTSVAAKLLLHNADIEAQNKDGCTPLLLALKENKHRMAEFLIKAKANIHAVDMRGRTALMLAVRYESPHIVKLLIEGGIDVFAEDVDGGTALCYSVASGCNMKIMFDCTEEKRKMRRRNTKEGSESSTEDSLTGCSDKPGPSHSMPDEGGNQSDTKNIAREKEELCKDFQQSSKDEAISDTGTRENKTLFDNSGTECQKEDEDEDNLVQFISIKTPFFSATDSKSEKPGVFTVQYPPVCLPGCVTGPFSEAEAFKEIINTPTNQSVPMKEAKTLKSAKPYLPVTPEDGRKILGGTQIQQPKAFLEINDTPPNQSVWMKDAKILKSEPHLDVTPKEGQDTLDGTEHQQSTTRICEICSPKCFDHFSLDALQMKKHIVEEMGPLSSPVSSSSKLKFSKPEDARKEGTPVSPVGMEIKNVLNEPFCRKCVCQAMGGGKVLGSEMDDPFHWTLHNWCSLTSSTTGGTAQVLGVQRTEELP
ncbi:uncharacterized protein LOC144365007 isoform X2 [Ictidomys tridecemlineatus]